MVREARVQSQIMSYQRLEKWYLIPPYLTLSNIRYISRVKWSNPGKEVAPSLTPQCSNYWKGSLLVALDYGHQLYLYIDRYAGHYWRSRDEFISNVLLLTSTYGRAKAQTYIQQLCEDMGCSPEDLPKAMNDRDKWRERIRDIHASGTTW